MGCVRSLVRVQSSRLDEVCIYACGCYNDLMKRISYETPKTSEITEHKVLGTIDASQIPASYGLVTVDALHHEWVATDDTADVRLWLDPKTKDRSSISTKTVNLDQNTALSAAHLSEADAASFANSLPKQFQVAKSAEKTHFEYAVGSGASARHPIEIVPQSNSTGADIATLHLAFARTVFATKRPLFAEMNMAYAYEPEGNKVKITVSVTYSPPRSFDEIDRDRKAKRDVSPKEIRYHDYLIDNPDIFLDPEEWSRQQSGLPNLRLAEEIFQDVQARIQQKKF